MVIAMIAALGLSLWRAIHRLDELNADPVTRAFALGLFAGLAGFCVSGTFLTQGFTWPIYLQLGFTAALNSYVNRLQRQSHATPAAAPAAGMPAPSPAPAG